MCRAGATIRRNRPADRPPNGLAVQGAADKCPEPTSRDDGSTAAPKRHASVPDAPGAVSRLVEGGHPIDLSRLKAGGQRCFTRRREV